MAKKKNKRKGIILIVLAILLVCGGIAGYIGYSYIYKPNVSINGKEFDYLYIATGSDFDKVKSQLYDKGWIDNKTSFEWVANQKKYSGKVKAGRYKIVDGMSNNDLINMLRAGKQEPVKF
ncbi:MAG: endolytic transglycosylase MltG, partial [Bacteroidota bacterium]